MAARSMGILCHRHDIQAVRGTNAKVRSPITLHDHLQVTPIYIGSPYCTSMVIVLIVYSSVE
jgi:hypothetical protein